MENSIRKLASIQIIENLEPIKDRDRIELAHVLGWQVIVKKDEFKIGDKCVFVEPDAVLPEKPEFEFLRSKKFRIKTMKMAGVLSQGIIFPLNIFINGKAATMGIIVAPINTSTIVLRLLLSIFISVL